MLWATDLLNSLQGLRWLSLTSLLFMSELGVASVSGNLIQNCSSQNSLVVLRGQQFPQALGVAVERLSLRVWDGRSFLPIPLQIDQRDKHKRYRLPEVTHAGLAMNDELVFRQQQAGQRAPEKVDAVLAEIKVADDIKVPGDTSRWVYLWRADKPEVLTENPLVAYDREKDRISTATYQLGFSTDRPFLIDQFRWQNVAGGTYSANIVDTMKIRHQGKLFGLMSFRRTQQDYTSKLTVIKQGPLRVIRRTENRVRVFWQLKSPSLLIDYVMMPDGFIMDTLIDLPFRIGAFFSQLETLTTVDWQQSLSTGRMRILDHKGNPSFVIDGEMTEHETALNQLRGTVFNLSSPWGNIRLSLDIPKSLPLQSWLYYMDDMHKQDSPEMQSGQFGNMGFRTTGWERLGRGVKHVRFDACLTKK
ncbi:MAG: hypothetical protein V3W04_12555 [Gammaproteobacteria bacterium]